MVKDAKNFFAEVLLVCTQSWEVAIVRRVNLKRTSETICALKHKISTVPGRCSTWKLLRFSRARLEWLKWFDGTIRWTLAQRSMMVRWLSIKSFTMRSKICKKQCTLGIYVLWQFMGASFLCFGLGPVSTKSSFSDIFWSCAREYYEACKGFIFLCCRVVVTFLGRHPTHSLFIPSKHNVHFATSSTCS